MKVASGFFLLDLRVLGTSWVVAAGALGEAIAGGLRGQLFLNYPTENLIVTTMDSKFGQQERLALEAWKQEKSGRSGL